MKVYYINADCGDGSSSTHFYDSKECIDFCCDEENGMEQYWDGDGGSWGCFEVPDGTPITGITIENIGSLEREKLDAAEDDLEPPAEGHRFGVFLPSGEEIYGTGCYTKAAMDHYVSAVACDLVVKEVPLETPM